MKGWTHWCRKALQIPLEQMCVMAPMPRRAGGVGGDQRDRTSSGCKLCTKTLMFQFEAIPLPKLDT